MAEGLDVFLHDQHVGVVSPVGRRSPEQVLLTWAPELHSGQVRITESFAALPGVKPDTSLVSRFLGGYGPEGNQREAMASERGIRPNDLFGVLREFGGSIAGALTFRLPGEGAHYEPSYAEISDSDLHHMMVKAVKDHDLGQRDDSRSMIPGFQPKLLLAKLGDNWLQPHGRAHSTHIIKPQVPSRPHAIFDEFYSHGLTRSMGLAQFASEILYVGRSPYLAIERFDRKVSDGKVQLIHQEDCAQALGLDWVHASSKFQNKDWPDDPDRPSAFKIAEVVASLNGENPLVDWLRQLTFRVLVGDNDGHAKNTGILHLPGEDTLTELYDAVPNLYQDDRIDWTMALAIDGHFDHRRMSVERLASEAGGWRALAAETIEATIAETLNSFRSALDTVPVPVPDGISPGLRDGLEWNLSRLAAGDEISQRRR